MNTPRERSELWIQPFTKSDTVGFERDPQAKRSEPNMDVCTW